MWKYWINLGLILFIFFSAATTCSENEEFACIEDIDDQCACITLYEPVCGCNGKTYGNSCEAECAGIQDYTKGACE